MAVTRLRNDKQLGKSTTAQSIMVSDVSNEASWFAPVDGSPKILYFNSDTNALTWLTMGTNISINETTNTLNASAGAGGYSEIQEEGSTVSASNTKINFIGSGVTAADAGAGVTSVTLNSFLNTLATQTYVNLASQVGATKLPLANIVDLNGYSVLGRSTSTSGVMAAITAASDHQVLRRSGSSIGFGAINLAQANAVSGVLDETNGGTGLSSYALGDTIYGSGTNTLAKLPGNTTTTKQFLSQTGTGSVSAAPVWATLSSADLSDGANLAHINATETISALWTFSTLPQSSQTPSSGNDFTNKAYVDSLVANQRKLSVRAATTANITLSGTQTIDTVSVVAGDRVLVKNQSTQSQNGIYVVAAGAWSRATDMDSASEVDGTFVVVEDGTQAGTLWLTVSEVTTLGTDSIVWTQVNKATDLVDGDGLIASGLTWAVDLASNSGLEFTSGALRIKSDTTTANTIGITLTSNGAGILHDTNTLTASGETLAVKTQMSITSDASGIRLSGDASTPGNNKYYGTNSSGTKGFHDIPLGSVSIVYIEGQAFSTTDLSANTGVVKDRNGNNVAFTVPTDVDTMEVYRNGLLLARTGTGTTRDYSISSNSITFQDAVTSADIILIKKPA